MDLERARSLLTAERERVQRQLADSRTAQSEEHDAEAETGDIADPAQSLTEQGVDDAVAAALRDRLAAIDRALLVSTAATSVARSAAATRSRTSDYKPTR